MKARGTLVVLAGAALPLVLLSGCGGDSSSTVTDPAGSDPTMSTSDTATSSQSSMTESASPTAKPKSPQCGDIWVEGKKLPWSYDGCYDADRRVKPDGRYCEIGKPLITYRNNWYATPGGPVNHTKVPLNQDPDYQQAVRACGG
jgi:hypothetical protein